MVTCWMEGGGSAAALLCCLPLVKDIEKDDLTSPVGGVRAARAYRNGRMVLSAAREHGHRRGEKAERRRAGRSKVGTVEPARTILAHSRRRVQVISRLDDAGPCIIQPLRIQRNWWAGKNGRTRA